MKKFETIMLNNINGNMFDYRKGLRGLSKIELLEYIQYAKSQYGLSSLESILDNVLQQMLIK